jgi:PBP1b-binding outer membrane lipoprotein LpoB
MVQFKSIVMITFVGLAILLSGCVGKQAGAPMATTTATPMATVTATPMASTTATPSVMVTTPTPITKAPMISGALSVTARMQKPTSKGIGTYELRALSAIIVNQLGSPISIKAQLVSDGQILEEQSFTLQAGSTSTYTNKGPYTINSTNVSLFISAEGYQTTEYKINTYG